MGTVTNSEDPQEIQHNAAFHQGLHYLLRFKQPSGTEMHHNLKSAKATVLTLFHKKIQVY